MEKIFNRISGLELTCCRDAETGLKTAREILPDVILLDINLPDMSGFEVLKILKSDARTNHIPVVAITASAMQDEKEKGLEAGFEKYISKPISIEELLNSIIQVISINKE